MFPERSGADPWPFFLLAFGISWLLWLPAVLSGNGLLPVPFDLSPLAVFGPSLAAFWLAWRSGGGPGVRQLAAKALDFRLPLPAVLTLLLPPVAVSILYLLLQPGSGFWQVPDFLPHRLLLFVYFLFILVFQGPVGEEFGWRGWALDRLAARYGWLRGSLVLGVFWGLWHLPLFLIPGTPHAESISPGWFLYSTLPLSVIMAWQYRRSGGGLPTPLLFHLALNVSIELNPFLLSEPFAFPLLVGIWTLAALWATRALRVEG